MNKDTLLKIALVFMIVMNTVLLVVLLMGKNHKKHHRHHHDRNEMHSQHNHDGRNHRKRRHTSPKEQIIEILHLSEEQIKSYESLIEDHKTTIEKLEIELRKEKSTYYNSLNKNIASEEQIEPILQTQKKIELTHFKHFKAIKEILKEDQLIYFDDLIMELDHILLHMNGRKRKPRGENHAYGSGPGAEQPSCSKACVKS